MGVGKNIKELCKMRGWTLKDLANYSSLSLNTIYTITKEDPLSVHASTLEKLCKALDVPKDSIISDGINMNGFYFYFNQEKMSEEDKMMSTIMSFLGYKLISCVIIHGLSPDFTFEKNGIKYYIDGENLKKLIEKDVSNYVDFKMFEYKE